MGELRKIREINEIRASLDGLRRMSFENVAGSDAYTEMHIAARLVRCLGNPVTALGGTLEMMGEQHGDALLSHALSILERMKSIMARTERLYLSEARLEPLEPLHLMDSVRQDLVPSKVRVMGPRVLGASVPLIAGDQRLLQEALREVAENGIQSMLGGGSLELVVSTDVEARAVCLRVLDSGSGIDEVHLNRVTEPFFSTRRRRAGLGLAIARHIAELHAGRLEITSRETGGTAVSIEIPAHE